MPFQMVHLSVARKAAMLVPGAIKDFSQYYLGSLAPDAVHFRADFTRELKRISHLCCDDEPWGETIDNEGWTENVLRFRRAYEGDAGMDFINGYCVHVLTDVRNNIDLAIPFKLREFQAMQIPDAHRATALQRFNADALYADRRIYAESPYRKGIWADLRRSGVTALRGIVSETEVRKIREHILDVQYQNVPVDASHIADVFSYAEYARFMDVAARWIANILFGAETAC